MRKSFSNWKRLPFKGATGEAKGAEDQWRGNYFWTGGARPRAPKSGTRNKSLRWNWSVFCPEKKRSPKKKFFAGLWASFCPGKKRSPKNKKKLLVLKRSVLEKKRSSLDLGVFLSQKWLRIQVSGGGQKSPRGAKISPGGQLPPCPPTSRAYAEAPPPLARLS